MCMSRHVARMPRNCAKLAINDVQPADAANISASETFYRILEVGGIFLAPAKAAYSV